jgi:hypothetical protein
MGAQAFWFSGVKVQVKMWEIATGDVEPQPMPGRKPVTTGEQCNVDRVHLPWLHQRR